MTTRRPKGAKKSLKVDDGLVNNWATRAAAYIKSLGPNASQARIAAAIIVFSKPLEHLLTESTQGHRCVDDTWYCCGKCPCVFEEARGIEPSHGHNKNRVAGVCDCGADEWNEKVRKAIDGPCGPEGLSDDDAD